MHKISSIVVFFIYCSFSCLCHANEDLHWADLPTDNLSKILYKYDPRLDQLNKLIQAYHKIEKTNWLFFPERISSLEKISSHAKEISSELQENYLVKVTLKLSKIALAKQTYLKELESLKKTRLETVIFNTANIPKKYIPLTINKGRKFKYQTQEVWGQYHIEAADPCHRRLLATYHDIWIKECPNCELSEFFLWLEDKNVSLFFPSVTLFTEKELNKHKAIIRDGKFYSSEGKLITTQGEGEKESELVKEPNFIKEPIFIVDGKEQIYICDSGAKQAHTSLSHYKPIIGSGSIWLQDGIIKKLSLNSGHYLPNITHYVQTFKFLEGKGIKIDEDIELRYYNGYDEIISTVKEFKKQHIENNLS